MTEPAIEPPAPSPSGPESRPPLWTWAAALALALVIVGGLALAHDALQPQIMARQLNLARFDRPSTRPRVVVIGASKSQCSIEFDEAMTARLRRLGVDADFVRVSYAQADFGQLRPALDRLRADPPAIVLVESELILLQPHAYRPPDYKPDSWISRMRKDLASLAGLHEHQDEAKDGAVACGEGVLTPHQRPLPVYRAMLARVRVSTAAERRPWLGELQALRGRGVQVAMIELQHAPAADVAFPAALQRDIEQVRFDLAQREGLPDLAPTFRPRQENFVDLGHRNRFGRAVYSDWLAGEIARMLREREAPPASRGTDP